MLAFAGFRAEPVLARGLIVVEFLVAHVDAVGVVPLSALLVLATNPEHLLVHAANNHVVLALFADVSVKLLELELWVKSFSRNT